MFDFFIRIIERFDVFSGFKKADIINSFGTIFLLIFVFILIVSFFILLKLKRSDSNKKKSSNSTDPVLYAMIGSLVISTLVTILISYLYMPRDPESLIKTTQIKEEQKVIIPSEGVTEVSLKLKDSDEKVHPSTLKDGEILTLTVTAGSEQFKKEFPYKKENLRIKKGKSEKVTSGVLLTHSFKDELFNHERIREEEDVILEIETADPFYNSEN